jgi:hypothetical protein
MRLRDCRSPQPPPPRWPRSDGPASSCSFVVPFNRLLALKVAIKHSFDKRIIMQLRIDFTDIKVLPDLTLES